MCTLKEVINHRGPTLNPYPTPYPPGKKGVGTTLLALYNIQHLARRTKPPTWQQSSSPRPGETTAGTQYSVVTFRNSVSKTVMTTRPLLLGLPCPVTLLLEQQRAAGSGNLSLTFQQARASTSRGERQRSQRVCYIEGCLAHLPFIPK